MQFLRSVHRFGLVLACTAAAACSDSTGPQDASADDVLADVSVGQSFATRGLEVVGLGGVPEPAAMRHDACAFNSGTKTFVCPTTTVNGITFSRSFQFLDASGNPQEAYSRGTTAAVRTVTDVDGIITSTTGNTTTTIDLAAHQEATLSGLLTGTHVLNADGTGTAIVTGGGLNHTIETTQTVTNLELPRRGSDNPYPKGVVATTAEVTADGFSGTSSATLTFDGTSEAILAFTVFGVTRTCTLDLSRRHSLPSCNP